MIAIHPPTFVSESSYYEIIYNKYINSIKNIKLLNYSNYVFETIFIKQNVIENNLILSNIITGQTVDNFMYHKQYLQNSIEYINNTNTKYGITKIYYDTINEQISNIKKCNFSIMYLTYFKIENNIKMNMLFNANVWYKSKLVDRINIYKFVYNLIYYLEKNLMIKFKSKTFGYMFKPIRNVNYSKKQIQFYLKNRKNKPLLQSMLPFLYKKKMNIGIYLYENIISENLKNKIKYSILSDINNPNYIQDKTKNRVKLVFGYNYVFFNNFFKNNREIWDAEEKIANGIRYHRNYAKIPNYLENIVLYLKKLNIISKKQIINQISIVHYFNCTNKTLIYESIGPHNERNKFDFVCALYFGISSELSINLKWNKVHGEYCIHLPSNCCIVFDSM